MAPVVNPIRRLVLAALLASIGVALSGFSIPLGPTRCFPVQHAVNAIAGVLLGPWWAAGTAFTTSTLRVALGTGTLFAFPGSIPGALAVGFAAGFLRQPRLAVVAEPLGTSIVGVALGTLVIAPAIHSKATFAMLFPPFLASSAAGAILGGLVLAALPRVRLGTGQDVSS